MKGMGYLILGAWPNLIKSLSLKYRRKCYVMMCLECFSGALWLLEGEVFNFF